MKDFRIKDYLLILMMCATTIENYPKVSLICSILYILFSGQDLLTNKVVYSNNISRIMAQKLQSINRTWGVLFIYLSLITILTPTYQSQVQLPIIDIRWLRAIVLFILVCKDVIQKPQILNYALPLYALSATVCAGLMSVGIGVAADFDTEDIGKVRLTFLGTNANKMAMVFVYGVACLTFFLKKNVFIKMAWITYAIVAWAFMVLLYAIGLTGSRGGFLLVLAIVGIYALSIVSRKRNALMTIVVIFGAIFLIDYIVDFIMSIDIFSRRVEMSGEGQYGERDILFNAAFKIFEDSPIWGIGLNRIYDKMIIYVGSPKTPHNLYLYILAAGGIIGFTTFISIIWRCLRIVYIEARSSKDYLPLLFLSVALLDFAKNGGALSISINYIAISIALAISIVHNKQKEI